MDYMICAHIAAGGNVKSLQTAYKLGCPINDLTVEAAAISGHIHILMWLSKYSINVDSVRLHDLARIVDCKLVIKWLIDHDSYFVLEYV